MTEPTQQGITRPGRDYPATSTAAGEVGLELDRMEKMIEVLGLEIDAAYSVVQPALADSDPSPESIAPDKRAAPASDLGRRLEGINNRLEDRISTLRNMTRRVAL